MRTGRPKAMLTISSEERTQLVAITRSRSLPAALTLRAKIVLACEREPSNAVVATRLGVGPHMIGKWRNRFISGRIEGLYDEMRSGRPRTVEDEAVAELITKTLARKPKAATHWSVRAIAKETGSEVLAQGDERAQDPPRRRHPNRGRRRALRLSRGDRRGVPEDDGGYPHRPSGSSPGTAG